METYELNKPGTSGMTSNEKSVQDLKNKEKVPVNDEKDNASAPDASTETAEEKFVRELKEKPLDYSRAGQAFIILSPGRSVSAARLSEKELHRMSIEDIIQKIMARSGKTREEIERMLADPF